jgi:hypothetical protein
MWKRCGSDKPQQNAAAMCGTSLAKRTARQAAADRSSCSRLKSRSPVLAGHRPLSRGDAQKRRSGDECPLSRKATVSP